jgi:hypothetical protein
MNADGEKRINSVLMKERCREKNEMSEVRARDFSSFPVSLLQRTVLHRAPLA